MSFEERADLLDDLLEEDESVFPLLECPSEVLGRTFATLHEAKALGRLSMLSRQGRALSLEPWAEDCWSQLVLQDFRESMGSQKRYQAGSMVQVTGPLGFAIPALALKCTGLGRVEWDALLLSASSFRMRYMLLALSSSVRQKWSPQHRYSWDNLVKRALRRMTHVQLHACIPEWSLCDKALGGPQEKELDDVEFQRARDIRNRRLRLEERTEVHTIHSIKQALQAKGLACTAKGAEPKVKSSKSEDQEEIPSQFLISPTATQQANAQANNQGAAATESNGLDAATAAEASAAGSVCSPKNEQAAISSPDKATLSDSGSSTRRALDAFSFEQQLQMAIEKSRKEAEDEGRLGSQLPGAQAPNFLPTQEQEKKTENKAPQDNRKVLCTFGSGEELVEVVLQESTASENIGFGAQLERSMEQIVLRLCKANWLTLYNGIAKEAGSRAWVLTQTLKPFQLKMPERFRTCCSFLDLETELLGLPFWKDTQIAKWRNLPGVAVHPATREPSVDEMALSLLQSLVEVWEGFEAWVQALESICGPLELQIELENAERRREIPQIATLCRMAFRSRGLLSDIFFPVALAIYTLIHGIESSPRTSEDTQQVLRTLFELADQYDLPDDDENTPVLPFPRASEEFMKFLVVPLARVNESLGGAPGQGPGSKKAGLAPKKWGEEKQDWQQDQCSDPGKHRSWRQEWQQERQRKKRCKERSVVCR
eukprot:gnl/MRDRNA2_/MRDRNA2_104390_c0_seq1.p1 gnl/MRDRNA2_/MRDRNA2_104390_c0~~gnl/MRDRNA2_/MRDRNA2_104390_c0_seq1.p1  ORF type:complete len:757 (+),score=158.69 gnl/MRDRNA2_/MRDRNA2_104390_c0_seq1:138-2273(+)